MVISEALKLLEKVRTRINSKSSTRCKTIYGSAFILLNVGSDYRGFSTKQHGDLFAFGDEEIIYLSLKDAEHILDTINERERSGKIDNTDFLD